MAPPTADPGLRAKPLVELQVSPVVPGTSAGGRLSACDARLVGDVVERYLCVPKCARSPRVI